MANDSRHPKAADDAGAPVPEAHAVPPSKERPAGSAEGRACPVAMDGEARFGRAPGRLEALFRNTSVGILVLDAEGRILDCNRHTGQMLGRPVAQLLGRTLASLMEPDGRLRVSATVACIAAGSGPCARVEARCSHGGGQPFWVDIALTGIEHADAGEDAVAAVMVDTEQAKMAHIRALERTTQALEPALLGADVRVWDLDLRTGEMRGQPMWEGLRGHQSGPATTSFELFAAAIHPDDLAAVGHANAEHMKGATPYCEVEFRVRDGNEGWRWLRQRCRIVEWDAHGHPVRVAGTYADITERKQAELERAELEAQIQHSQKLESLGMMAGGVAHDFKNILVGVLGNTSLAMLQLPAGSPAREHILRAEAAARKASELAAQMLAYSGKGKPSVGAVDLHALVADMSELLEASLPGQVALRVAAAPTETTVVGDHCQLGQVALNLVVNAADAIGPRPGFIAVDVRAVHLPDARQFSAGHGAELPSGDYVRLRVTDDGCGMDAATRGRLFEPFFTTKSDGRGLGLATVMGIVAEHSGAIEVQSQVGRGTTFDVYFPAAGVAAEQVPSRPPQEGPRAAVGTLLVADDDQTVRDVAQAVLQMAGFTVLPAADGQQALDLFHRSESAIVGVLLDLNMPVLDGEQVMAHVRRARPEVPIVVSSGDGAARARQLQATAFLDKPYGVKELLDVIHRVVGG